MDVYSQSLTKPGPAPYVGLDTPSELAARLTLARSTLAPRVPCPLWQTGYVRVGRYLEALGAEPAAYEALIRRVLVQAAERPEDEFITAALALVRREARHGAIATRPAINPLQLPPAMPELRRRHMRPVPLRRRELRDIWDRHLKPLAMTVARLLGSAYRTLQLITS